jgi:predicted transcriptional regulator
MNTTDCRDPGSYSTTVTGRITAGEMAALDRLAQERHTSRSILVAESVRRTLASEQEGGEDG